MTSDQATSLKKSIPNSKTSSRTGKGENFGSRTGLTICVEVQPNASGNKEKEKAGLKRHGGGGGGVL